MARIGTSWNRIQAGDIITFNYKSKSTGKTRLQTILVLSFRVYGILGFSTSKVVNVPVAFFPLYLNDIISPAVTFPQVYTCLGILFHIPCYTHLFTCFHKFIFIKYFSVFNIKSSIIIIILMSFFFRNINNFSIFPYIIFRCTFWKNYS